MATSSRPGRPRSDGRLATDNERGLTRPSIGQTTDRDKVRLTDGRWNATAMQQAGHPRDTRAASSSTDDSTGRRAQPSLLDQSDISPTITTRVPFRHQPNAFCNLATHTLSVLLRISKENEFAARYYTCLLLFLNPQYLFPRES